MIRHSRGNAEQTKPFLGHLEDLRKTLIRSAMLLGIGILIALPLAPYILYLAKMPLVRIGIDPDSFLRVIRVAGGLAVTMRVVFWSGVLLSLPFILLVVGQFILPGLTDKEKRILFHTAGLALVLFVVGLSMGYFVTLPVAIQMIMRINEWLGVSWAFVELSDYMSFVLRLLIAFGLAFELPVLLLMLGRLGIVSSKQLRQQRSYVIVGILFVAMLLTPPDPITQLAMAVPLTLLYELCIWMIWFSERAKRRADV